MQQTLDVLKSRPRSRFFNTCRFSVAEGPITIPLRFASASLIALCACLLAGVCGGRSDVYLVEISAALAAALSLAAAWEFSPALY